MTYSGESPVPPSTPPQSLPPELLATIADRLTDAVDYVAFRGVCKAWRLAAKPSDVPKQLPWFLVPYASSSDRRRFYNRCKKRIRVRSSDELVGSVVVGSSFGWLALVSAVGAALSLWNPLTNSTIELPSLTSLPAYSKVSLTASPADPACFVLLVLEFSSRFAYCRVGDVSWSICTTELSGDVAVVVLCGGLFYVFDNEGDGVVSTGKETIKIRSPQRVFHMLDLHVVEAGGVLYMVQNYMWIDETDEEEQCIDVFKLGFARGSYFWEKAGDIGGFAIFLSDNHASVVRASEYPGFEGDSVYFCGHDVVDYELKGVAAFVYNVKRDEFWMWFRFRGWLDGMQSATWVVPSLL